MTAAAAADQEGSYRCAQVEQVMRSPRQITEAATELITEAATELITED